MPSFTIDKPDGCIEENICVYVSASCNLVQARCVLGWVIGPRKDVCVEMSRLDLLLEPLVPSFFFYFFPPFIFLLLPFYFHFYSSFSLIRSHFLDPRRYFHLLPFLCRLSFLHTKKWFVKFTGSSVLIFTT